MNAGHTTQGRHCLQVLGIPTCKKRTKSLSLMELTYCAYQWLAVDRATVPLPSLSNSPPTLWQWPVSGTFYISVWYFVWLGKWCYQHVRWYVYITQRISVIIFIPVWEVEWAGGRGSEVNVSEPKLECVGQIWMCWSDSLSCKPQDQDTQLKWARKRHCISLKAGRDCRAFRTEGRTMYQEAPGAEIRGSLSFQDYFVLFCFSHLLLSSLCAMAPRVLWLQKGILPSGSSHRKLLAATPVEKENLTF